MKLRWRLEILLYSQPRQRVKQKPSPLLPTGHRLAETLVGLLYLVPEGQWGLCCGVPQPLLANTGRPSDFMTTHFPPRVLHQFEKTSDPPHLHTHQNLAWPLYALLWIVAPLWFVSNS